MKRNLQIRSRFSSHPVGSILTAMRENAQNQETDTIIYEWHDACGPTCVTSVGGTFLRLQEKQ